MVGGAPWTWWIGFHVAVVALLAVDAVLPGTRGVSKRTQKIAWLWTGFLILVAAGFAWWIAARDGHALALQWVAGYAIETSLSVDNLFVFLIIFKGFEIGERGQHKALLWGIAGAVVLRALMIALGITLLEHFEWLTYVFGVFLFYAAWRLMSGGSAKAAIPSWIRKRRPSESALLPVILAVEITDLLFAVDSIPAVLAISKDPFVVYTSNIAAILGLRSLYFVLANLLERLRFLHYGLGALLVFMGIKMIGEKWIDVPITLSLAIIGAILALCAIISAMFPGKGHVEAGVAREEK